MFTAIIAFLKDLLGLPTSSFMILFQMIIRGIVIYFFGITLARFNKKLLGIRTPFNLILFIMLGSIFASAIIDGRTFLPIIVTVLFLSLLNGAMTMLSYYVPAVETFVKGGSSTLVQDGKIQWDAMKKNFITQHELFNELQTQLHTRDLDRVKAAILASDGTINFIEKR